MSQTQPKATPIEVNPEQLPAACPPREQAQWNMHPRIYLDFNKSNEAHCPYCGNLFALKKLKTE